ncbi:sensor histidine kinase [Xanthomonas sacchari]|uniref:sensor histidine kinase n=1 Tax=Xanthomonas sacchari TaxID=56458 RepID=UPI0035277711
MADAAPDAAQVATPTSRLGVLLLVWGVLALTAIPALYLSGGSDGVPHARMLGNAALFMLGSYLPWMLATPALLHLCERWPLGQGRSAWRGAYLLLAGLLIVPLLSTAGWWLARALTDLAGLVPQPPLAPGQWRRSVLVTTLFAAPTYLAVIGAGQTLASVRRDRRRNALLAQARQQALRTQLQHHFLFNALNAIGALGYRDAARADQALAHLGQLLRTALECPERQGLREEIGAAMSFVDLHRLLLGDALTLQVDADPLAWQAEVPALLLQPLLENAIRHGALDAQGLRVSADVAHGQLQIQVRNRVDDAVQPARTVGTGLGLDNIRQRLAVLYGGQAHLHCQRDADTYLAQLSLPYRRAHVRDHD